jgi:hypothetical protein
MAATISAARSSGWYVEVGSPLGVEFGAVDGGAGDEVCFGVFEAGGCALGFASDVGGDGEADGGEGGGEPEDGEEGGAAAKIVGRVSGRHRCTSCLL